MVAVGSAIQIAGACWQAKRRMIRIAITAAAFNAVTVTTFRSDGGHSMKKKMAALALALAGSMSLSACATPAGTGALAGGAIGAGTGALIGSAAARPRWHCHRWGFDQFGNRRCLAWMR